MWGWWRSRVICTPRRALPLTEGYSYGMSKGIGKTQQAILDALAAEKELAALTVVELAQRLGASPRQIRAAVHSLAGRGLVVLTKQYGGWRGYGEQGRAVPRRYPWDSDAPTAFVLKEGEPWPFPDGWGNHDHGRVASRDVEFIRKGMPTGVSLFVWLPERREKYLASHSQQSEAMGRMFGQAGNGARWIKREEARELGR